MKVFQTLLTVLLALAFGLIASAQDPGAEPSTYLFAQKDSVSLFMDIYDPAPGSPTELDGTAKPSVLFIFGGGFVMGARNEASYLPWFRRLTADGYRVISIDYRLGLRGVKKMGIAQVDILENAINLVVEDLFSATKYLIDNAAELGIDPERIVISGSSAGAISALQAEYTICNGGALASMLPEGFNYAGVMAFAGAILSRQGAVKFAKEPCPVFLAHGTADKLVPYDKIGFMNLRFAGAKQIAAALEKAGSNYNVLRFPGRGHEIAAAMIPLYREELRFLETNVSGGYKRIVDATINDPSYTTPAWADASLDDLYQ